MTPQGYCHQICKKSGSNFVYTFYLFGKKRRRALEAFYAFCRQVDDAVDQAETKEKASAALAYWKEELPLLYQGTPRHPIVQALSGVVKDYEIPQKYLEEIVAGCEMDLYKNTFATFEELEDYCFKVASSVGLVCLCLFGVSLDPETKQAAASLGKALQLTNILRDIVTDLERGRVYLPEEDLKKFHVTAEDLRQRAKENLDLLDLFYFEIDRARKFYNEAWQHFPREKKVRRRLIAAFLMGRFYEEILNKISRAPLQVLQTKVRLTKIEKLKIALGEILKCL